MNFMIFSDNFYIITILYPIKNINVKIYMDTMKMILMIFYHNYYIINFLF